MKYPREISKTMNSRFPIAQCNKSENWPCEISIPKKRHVEGNKEKRRGYEGFDKKMMFVRNK